MLGSCPFLFENNVTNPGNDKYTLFIVQRFGDMKTVKDWDDQTANDQTRADCQQSLGSEQNASKSY